MRQSAVAQRRGVLGGLGSVTYRHRWMTLLIWVIGLIGLVFAWVQFGAPAASNFTGKDPGQTILSQHFARQSGDALTLAIRSSAPVTAPAVRAHVASALATFRGAANVSGVSDPYTTPGQVSRGGHIAYATVQFSVQPAQIPGSEVTALIKDATSASRGGVTFDLGGDVVDLAETTYGGPTNGVGVTAAAIVLLIAFGSLLAMGLPLLTGIFGIGTGLSLIALLGHIVPAPSFSPIVASLIGLGVGIDYALFIVTRFRENLRDGSPAHDACVAALQTAGRSVLTAGTTVVIGMLGLLVLRQPLINGVAVAAAATVAMTVLSALTLLPAMLGFTGTRLAKPSRLRLPGRRRTAVLPATAVPATAVQAEAVQAEAGPATAARPSAAERWSGVVQRRPLVAALLATGILLALAAPALSLKLNMPDDSAQARGTMGYASYATMAQGFGPGFDAPLILAATVPSPQASTTALAQAVAHTRGVARVTPVQLSPDGKAVMLIAYPTTGEQDTATNALVNKLNQTVLPRATAGTGIRAYVTGPNAANVTFANIVGQRLPWLVGVVVALSMVLLLITFRSVVVAVKAAVMNLLSVVAAYGVLTAVTQWGWGHQLFGFPEKLPVTTWVPVFLFVILFGLSMDYEVFLLSRIREDYDATGDASGSVGRGLSRTARVISAAAAIMVVVFLSATLGGDVSVKQIGLGLAAAVLIDATLVRLVLVPAVMEMLGRANWWLPRPLARILPGRPAPQSTPPASGPPPDAALPDAALREAPSSAAAQN